MKDALGGLNFGPKYVKCEKDNVFYTLAKSLISFWENKLESKIQKVPCVIISLVQMFLNLYFQLILYGTKNIQVVAECTEIYKEKDQQESPFQQQFIIHEGIKLACKPRIHFQLDPQLSSQLTLEFI